MNKKIGFFQFVIIFLFLWSQAHGQVKLASPLQFGHYYPGYINVRDWSAMPPGLLILDYNAYYWGNKFYDKNGDLLESVGRPNGNPINLDIDISGFSTVPCLFWGSSFKLLGGARYFAGAMIDYSTYSAAAAYQKISQIIDTLTFSGDVSGTTSGLGDLALVPVGFSWELKRMDINAWYTLYTPTGRYETGADDNMGLGFWTHQIQLALNIYPFFQGDEIRATDFMISPSMEFNSKIKDVDVRPGSRFSLEYGISQYLSERFEIGVIGSNNWQVGKDTGSDVYWDQSFKDKISTIGGLVGFWPLQDRLYISVMYLVNYGAVQNVKANTAQLNLYFDTNLLKKKGMK